MRRVERNRRIAKIRRVAMRREPPSPAPEDDDAGDDADPAAVARELATGTASRAAAARRAQ